MNKKKLITIFACSSLLLGGAVLLAKQEEKQALQTKAVVDASSYTMNPSEIEGAIGRLNNCTKAITDDNMLRLTSIATGQFHYFFQFAETYSFYQLAKDCTSITVSLKVSNASEIGNRIFFRCWQGETENYAWQDIDLAAAAADFIDVTFDKLEGGTYFDGLVFSSNVADAYVEIESLTFNGLTSFNVVNYSSFVNDWNHHDKGDGVHATLFNYDGDFRLQSAGADYAAQFGDKITLNGVPWKNVGTIDHAHGARYLQFNYLDSVMESTISDEYPRPVIEIHDIVPFEGSFLTPHRIVFDGTQWIHAIEDDDLIKNSDYVLFTPSDYGFNHHDQWAFYNTTAMGELAGHQSFGMQFTLKTNNADGTGYFQLLMGDGAVTQNALIFTYISNILYVEQINGKIGDEYSLGQKDINISLADQQEHLIELYYIVDSSANTAVIICGVDGAKAFRTNPFSIVDFKEYQFFALKSLFGDEANTTIASSPSTDTQALERFYARALDNPVGDTYMEKYANAKAYYDTYLAPGQRTALAESSAYAGIRDIYNRLKFEAINEYATPKKAELESYIADLSIYASSEQEEIADIIAAGKAAMESAESYEEVDEILAEYKAALDDVPTFAELLAEYKETKKAELENYVSEEDYLPADWDRVEEIIVNGKDNIDVSETFAEVDTQVEGFKQVLDEVPTKTERAQEAAANVDELIDAIPSIMRDNYERDKHLVTEAREAYDALSEEAKGYVTKLYLLQGAEGRVRDIEAAIAVDDLISAIGEVTLEKEQQIVAARTAYNALSANQNRFVQALGVLQAAEAKLAELKEQKAHVDEVEGLINAIGNVDSTKATKDRIDAAYNAYQALTFEEKAMVSNKATLDSALANFDNAVGISRQNALDDVEEYYYGINMKKYSQENQDRINQLYADVQEIIQAQEYSDNLAQIVNEFKAAVEAVPQKKAPAKGCGGSIVATSVVLSTLALAGLGLAISKKRKED